MSAFTEFLTLLVDPVDASPLLWDCASQQLSNPSGAVYILKNGVPVLLPLSVSDTAYSIHYQKDAEEFDYTDTVASQLEQVEMDRLHQQILSSRKNTNGYTLDVGCGNGWVAASLIKERQKIISMDISDVNPLKAIQSFPAQFHFGLVADVYHLPLKKESMDCVIASEIIEHVPDPAVFIARLWEVVAPGGQLIITTPYNEFIRTTLCIHCNCPTPVNAHLHSFTEEKMLQILPLDVKRKNVFLINSKLLVQLRVQKLFRYLPLSIWQIIDRVAIKLTGKKCYRMIVVMEK